MTEHDNQGGSDAPLVSVIVRTTNRPLLTKALESIVRQSYRPLEIILVDATGKGLGKEGGGQVAFANGDDLPVTVVNLDIPLPRARAANAGLAAGNGQYLMFLDEDDWIAPAHITGLVDTLKSNPTVKAAYSTTRKVDLQGKPLDDKFAFDYDPALLKRDNYIPIHAMLFSRSLVDEGCRFDESLEIYEDWDFWLQLSRRTDFLHLDQETAFYRQGGDSDTDIIDDKPRFQAGHRIADARAQIYAKWSSQWSGEELNDLIGKTATRDQLLAVATELDLRSRQLKDLSSYNNSLKLMLNKSTKEIESLTRKAEGLERTFRQQKRDHAISDLHRDRNIRDLENTLNGIYALRSWRLMGPFRRMAGLFDQVLLPVKKRVHLRRYGTELVPQQQQELTIEPVEPDPGDQRQHEEVKSRFKKEAEANLQQLLESDAQLPFPETKHPQLSILLVLYNQAPLTLLCLESILKFAPAPYELVVVDNASGDETGELLERLSNTTIVRNSENLGFVKAVNQGLEQCRGEYLLLLNNDAMLHLYSIESAIATLQDTPQAGAVGGRILLLDGRLQEAGSIIFRDGSCLGYGRHGDPEAPEYMFQRPVDYCSGAFLLFETGLFRQMGGFDLDYAPAYYEDSDFCIRLQEHGLKVIYDPNAVITHYEFASSGGQQKAGELQTRHRQVLLQKHGAFLARQPQADADSALYSRTANNHKNILIIDDRVPHPSLGAGYPRCCEIVKLLATEELNISFYPLQFPDESWLATYRSLPATVEVLLEHGTQSLPEFLRKRRGFYQTVMVSRIHNMEAVNEVLAAQPDLLGNARLIYDAEAITAPREILQRQLQGEQLTQEQENELLEKEIHAARTADTIITVSSEEAAVYSRHGYDNTIVLGHSLALEPTARSFDERRGLLFVGALRDENSPNVDSLHWFINDVWPLLKSSEAELELHVVGDNEASSLQELDSERIHFHGRLDTLDDIYESVRVFIAPTRFAAGIPHKVHEAAARGVPCVVTELLARQLNWQHDRQLLAGDSPQLFADNCLTLYRDSECWQRIRNSALESVTRECSPEEFKSTLLQLFT